MPLAAGTRLGPYEIESFIGAGAMGEVYRGRDTRLDRTVAVKVLPPGVASDPEHRARFEREAKAVAALNHPNIVTIHAIEEAAGFRFLAMELVEGRTLNQVIPKGGLPLEQFLDLAVPLADAVAFAHRHGIVHRDLKPANIMLADAGRVKVLDFGLAKLKPHVSSTETTAALATLSLTQPNAIVGTAAYMSPEQAEGRPVDHRSDVFSLGVVLYEMACGRRPFNGETSVSGILSIVRGTPPPLSGINREVPPCLDRIVSTALAKDPTAVSRTSSTSATSCRRCSGRARPAASQRCAASSSTPPGPVAWRSPSRRWRRAAPPALRWFPGAAPAPIRVRRPPRRSAPASAG